MKLRLGLKTLRPFSASAPPPGTTAALKFNVTTNSQYITTIVVM